MDGELTATLSRSLANSDCGGVDVRSMGLETATDAIFFGELCLVPEGLLCLLED